jgi:hypothetical protein
MIMMDVEIPCEMFFWLKTQGNPDEVVKGLVQKEMLLHR